MNTIFRSNGTASIEPAQHLVPRKMQSLVVLGLLSCLPAIALSQTNAAADKDSLEEIVVTGIASNYKNSILGKRAADGIVDMLDTDELGRLPDKNIGETLNRIPGVTMLLEKGEGRFVQIRGVSPRLNNVTINGMQLGSVDTDEGGRAAPLDVIGGEMLSGVQVAKTPTSDMDGTGIGGTLNLTTKAPFDYDNNFTVLGTVRMGHEGISNVSVTDAKETPWSADITLAGKTADQKLGWIVGASYANRKIPLLGVFQDEWRPVTYDPTPGVPGDEESILLPGATKNNVTIVGRERLNFNAMLEFRPTDTSRYFIRSFVAGWDELQFRNRYNHGLSDQITSLNGEESGTISGNRVQVDLRSEPAEKDLFSIAIGGENILGPWTYDYTVQFNDNSVSEPNDRWEFRTGSNTVGPDDFTVESNRLVTITSNGLNPQDPSLQGFRRVRFEKKRSDETTAIGVFNARRDLNLSSTWIDNAFVKFGAKMTETDRDRDDSVDRWDSGAIGWNAGTDPSLNGGAFTNPVPISDRPNLWLDFDGLSAYFAANQNDPDLFEFNQDATFSEMFQDDFKITERVVAAYAMGKIEFGASSLVGGVRIEDTKIDASAFTMGVDSGTGTLTSTPISDGGSYTNVLPSLIFTTELTDTLVFRAAFNQAIGRPDFDAIAPRSSLDVEDNPILGTVGTLSIGNPKLEARESSNYDLSLEWYFDEGSILAVALFYKDISNEIIGAPTQRFQNYTFQGQTYDQFEINTTINAQSSSIKGVEFTFVDVFEFLPEPFNGLGFASAVTFLDSEIDIERNGVLETLPLFEQADSSLSLTLFFQKGPFDFSATYNRNDNFLTDLGPVREFDLDQGAYERVDARFEYSATDNLKFFLEGTNLNNEPTTEFQGGRPNLNTEYEYAGRTVFIGATSSF